MLAFIPAGKFLTKANQRRLVKYAYLEKQFWGWFSDNQQNKNKFKIMLKSFNFKETGLFLSSEIFFSIGGEELSSFKDFKNLYNKLNTRLSPQKRFLPLKKMNKVNNNSK